MALPPDVLAEARRIADEAPPLSREIQAELRDRMRPLPEPERKAS